MDDHLIIRLRNATSQIHKDLEALPVSKVVMSPDLTTAAYIDYLQRMLIIHHAVETSVFPIVRLHIPDLDFRRKEPLILQDLAALEAFTEISDIFTDTAFRNTPAFCIGMMYVSEGSTLGGQYILKNVCKTLGYTGAQATTFLDAYGPRTGSMWKTFMEALNTYGKTLAETQMQEVEAGAIYGFERTAAVMRAGNL
jgi:heme oxygenase (biliverdin-IX-beta and delta-forming)